MQAGETLPDKRSIAGSFGRAANTYDRHADLQRDTLMKLAGKESFQPLSRILDLGSGTGFGTDYLSRLYPKAEIISLDIALPMLQYAKEKYLADSQYPVCADAELLPFFDGSFDAIFSNLTIQWCNHYAQLFSEIRRVLRAGGKALFSTFGPETLNELRKAWLAVDDQAHVNRFMPAASVVASIQSWRFNEVTAETERVIRHYPEVGALASELRAIGANCVPRISGQGLSGKRRLQQLQHAFQQGQVKDLGVPVTFEILYICLTG